MRRIYCVPIAFAISWTWGAALDYQLDFDPDFKNVAVRAQLNAGGLVLRARSASPHRLDALRGCSGQPIDGKDDASIALPADIACVQYTASLEQRGHQARLKFGPGGARLTSPSRWMWLPELAGDDTVNVTVTLPRGASASFPWRAVAEGKFQFGASPASGMGLAVLGEFIEIDLAQTGIVKPAVFLGAAHAAQQVQKVSNWLTATALMLQQITGSVPNPHMQIIVVPADGGRGRSPVPFGRVVRDQGESIHFFVDLQQGEARYLADWTAPHEFAHTLIPYVDARWVSEGFAGYFQNVMLARRGVYSADYAWQRLTNSLSRGADLADPPSPNDTQARPFREVRMLLYWSGAALALLADAELRSASNNDKSLDSVLRSFARCCLPAGKSWTAEELFAALDRHGGNGVFMRLYDAHADTPGMPDLTALYLKLGIVRSGTAVVLDDQAPWAHVRRAIMRGSDD